jgi:hypothetical protein
MPVNLNKTKRQLARVAFLFITFQSLPNNYTWLTLLVLVMTLALAIFTLFCGVSAFVTLLFLCHGRSDKCRIYNTNTHHQCTHYKQTITKLLQHFLLLLVSGNLSPAARNAPDKASLSK